MQKRSVKKIQSKDIEKSGMKPDMKRKAGGYGKPRF
jgi:hypothetical protein